MFVCSPPSAVLSAGAMTTANRIGVSSGTAIWRGLCAVSAARRFARVSSALRVRVRTGARRGTAAGCMAVAAMGSFLSSGGFGELVAGEPQGDVVEGGLAGGDAGRGDAGFVDHGDGFGGGALAPWQRDRRADGKRL